MRRKTEPSLTARAFRLLARRDHTRRELSAKLTPHLIDGDDLERLLDDLAARGWLSDARVVEQVVHARRARFGPARIRQVLIARGVPELAAAQAARDLRAGELDAATGVWARKFRGDGGTQAERAKQVRFLQARGFSFEVAMRVVRTGAK